jgi:hypothetical protein
MELDEQMLSVAPRLGAIVDAVDSLDGGES